MTVPSGGWGRSALAGERMNPAFGCTAFTLALNWFRRSACT